MSLSSLQSSVGSLLALGRVEHRCLWRAVLAVGGPFLEPRWEAGVGALFCMSGPTWLTVGGPRGSPVVQVFIHQTQFSRH